MTAYASPEQAGAITDMDMSKGRTYRYLQDEPLYPFGFGLSKHSTLILAFFGSLLQNDNHGGLATTGYTTWKYSSLRTNISSSVLPNSPVSVTVTVKNTGAIDSAQVVQLYAALSSDFVSTLPNVSRHVPVRQLVAFQKVFVRSGESQDVSMVLVPDQLSGWHLFHANGVTVYLAAGDVSPTAKTLSSLVRTSVHVM